MAPEVILDQMYNEKCDIWSIGHIFYILLAFKHPFDNEDQRIKGKYDKGALT
jgi:serine/threonine protein kinase